MTSHKKSHRSPGLAALTGAALALPAISQLAHANAPVDKTEIGYRYSQYKEDALEDIKVISGTNERYDIDNNAFTLVTPISSDLILTVDADYETMTGASPFSTIQLPGRDPQLIMSGASIEESRTDILASLRKKREDGAMTGSFGYSTENDYDVYNAAVEYEQLSADRLKTYSGGIGVSTFDISPVQEEGVNRTRSESKWSANGFFAVAKVLSPAWQVQGGVFASLTDGYLSDPYKALDSRPDSRQAWGFTGRSRYYLKPFNAAFHIDYRFYNDDWGIESHMVEIAWHQSLGDHFRVAPIVRYYSQSQADFYVEADNPLNTGEYSSDFRLSPFGAMAYGMSFTLDEKNYSVTLYAESYQADGDLALKSVDVESPGLLTYNLMSVGFNYRF